MNAALWLAIPALPLLVASLRLFPALRQAVPLLMPLGVAPALAVAAREPAPTRLPWLLLGSEMGLDPAGRILLTLAALLWGAAALYCLGYLKGDARRDSFMTYFLLTMSGNLWLIVARDPATFYVAFALMTFAAYGLVVHTKTPEAVRAGRIYLVMAVLGEVCIATGLWMLVGAGADAGTAGRLGGPFLLLLAGFGVKAGALPLHVWLPLAHPVAPTPASAVLSGVMIKAGLLGWIRFLPSHGPEAASVLVLIGIGAAIGGAVYGLVQRDTKVILAYSSISQVGWMIIGIASMVAAPAMREEAAAAVALYALHHGLVKGSLFLSVGLKSREGVGIAVRRSGQTALAFTMAAAPLTGGAAAKHAVKELVPLLPGLWPQALPPLLAVAATGTALLMIRFLAAAWPKGEKAAVTDVWQWAAWIPLVLASPVLPLLAARGTFEPPTGLAGQLAPLLAAGLASLAAAALFRRRGMAASAWPAGDILVPLEAFSRRLLALWKRSVGPVLGGWRAAVYSFQWHEPHELFFLQRMLDLGEGWWGRWSVCGLLFLLALVATALMLLPRVS